MSTQTAFVARQYRLQEWAEQIHECNNRPADMTVTQWCEQHDITTANFYYRKAEVRTALLPTVQQNLPAGGSDQEISFVDISAHAVKPAAPPAPENKNPAPAAVLHCGPVSIELFNSAESVFIHSIMQEALKHAE